MPFTFRSAAFIVFALCLLSACTAPTRADVPAAATESHTQITCQSAADCAIKDVGSCCGYYPACVHKDQSVDPDAVRARCKVEDRSSICGFPEITACACVEGRCINSGSGIGSNGDPREP